MISIGFFSLQRYSFLRKRMKNDCFFGFQVILQVNQRAAWIKATAITIMISPAYLVADRKKSR